MKTNENKLTNTGKVTNDISIKIAIILEIPVDNVRII